MDIVADFEEEVMEIDAYLSLALAAVADQFQQIGPSFVELSQSLLDAELLDDLQLAVGFGDLVGLNVEG